MATTPNSIITPQAVKTAQCAVTTANTTFSTTPSNTVLLVTAGANGSRITKLVAVPLETVTANFLQAYRSADSGTTNYLVAAVTGGSDTVSATDGPTILAFENSASVPVSENNPLLLGANERLYVATGITKNYHITAEYSDY